MGFARTGSRGALLGALGALALGGVVPHASHADPAPCPVFLPPRGAAVCSPDEPSKKDARAAYAPPARRDPLCTLFNVHTREALALDVAAGTSEASLVARLLRDRTTWEEHPIDPVCLATLRGSVTELHATRVELVSGYRSDKLNEHLRKKGRHVARRSQHVLGRAVDFRLGGVETRDLLRYVRAHHVGGVGFYPGSGFVHVDAGRRRSWQGE